MTTISRPDAGAFDNLMGDVSAYGTSGSQLLQDANAFLSAASKVPGGDPQTVRAVDNMVASLQNGTYSQQGTEAALKEGSQLDQVPIVVISPFSGNDAGDNPNSNWVGNAVSSLEGEIRGGAPSNIIAHDANVLAVEATEAGRYNDVAEAAGNIAASLRDGSFNPDASIAALNDAVNKDVPQGIFPSPG
jgi:hypothetical protein